MEGYLKCVFHLILLVFKLLELQLEDCSSNLLDMLSGYLLFWQVAHIHKRKWIEETTYPRFTMIGQSLGSIYLSWEALCIVTPLYYFDTSGYAFTYPVARMFGCKVICYTHYPTISLDMLSRVHARSSMYNNDALIAKRYSYCNLVGIS